MRTLFALALALALTGCMTDEERWHSGPGSSWWTSGGWSGSQPLERSLRGRAVEPGLRAHTSLGR